MIRMISILMLGLLFSLSAFAQAGPQGYFVTVTNLTKGQIFAPIVVATHKSTIQMFEPGDAALPELATLAESGNPGPLQALLDSLPTLVQDTNTSDGMLLPGESVTIKIIGSRAFNRLSLAGMMVSSNDAFIGLDSMVLPESPSVRQWCLLMMRDPKSMMNTVTTFLAHLVVTWMIPVSTKAGLFMSVTVFRVLLIWIRRNGIGETRLRV